MLQCHPPGASLQYLMRHGWYNYLLGSGDRELSKLCSAAPLQDTVTLVATMSLLCPCYSWARIIALLRHVQSSRACAKEPLQIRCATALQAGASFEGSELWLSTFEDRAESQESIRPLEPYTSSMRRRRPPGSNVSSLGPIGLLQSERRSIPPSFANSTHSNPFLLCKFEIQSVMRNCYANACPDRLSGATSLPTLRQECRPFQPARNSEIHSRACTPHAAASVLVQSTTPAAAAAELSRRSAVLSGLAALAAALQCRPAVAAAVAVGDGDVADLEVRCQHAALCHPVAAGRSWVPHHTMRDFVPGHLSLHHRCR